MDKNNVVPTLEKKTGIPIIFLTLCYTFFPGFVLKIFFPAREYNSLQHYLGFFAIYMVLFNYCSLLSSLYLSIGKTYITAVFWILAAILELIYIGFVHATIYQIIVGLFTISAILLICFLIYYPFAVRYKNS